jgi:hypothetical protein
MCTARASLTGWLALTQWFIQAVAAAQETADTAIGMSSTDTKPFKQQALTATQPCSHTRTTFTPVHITPGCPANDSGYCIAGASW